ncbi:uncharacterized protein LOC131619186 [Vicia villosa]|uniref:uncharacterized protein LOC131619186 n=1 Tax=Vicia villosa TaxID=3911 RepID=UPI00273B2FBB|nr:uncharacterized protein LOC131619186 [Vicia villosa]
MASCLKRVSVAAMGGWFEGKWQWDDFGLFAGVPGLTADLASLRGRLEGFCGMSEGKDLLEWTVNSEAGFSVASCFAFYGSSQFPFGPPNKFDGAIGLVWKSEVPFKIKAFAWRLLLNRLPTKDILVCRGISFPLDNLKYIFCGIDLENRDHSFFYFFVVKKIWSEIAFWVGKLDMEEECCRNLMD